MVLKMRIFEEKTFAQIAKELNVPLGTALSRMRLALSDCERKGIEKMINEQNLASQSNDQLEAILYVLNDPSLDRLCFEQRLAESPELCR